MTSCKPITTALRALSAAGLLAVSNHAAACSVCFGDPASNQTQAMNMAIMTLLVITLGVLAGIATVAVLMIRRADAANTPGGTAEQTSETSVSFTQEISHG